MAEQVTLFDVGVLALLLTWALCWPRPDRWRTRLRALIALSAALSNGLMVAALVWRGLAAGHIPLNTKYEFGLAFIATSTLAYTLIGWRAGWAPLGRVALIVPLLLAVYVRWGIPASQQAIRPPVPALQSIWLPVHVIAAAIAYGFFAVAFGAALPAFFTSPASQVNAADEDEQSGGMGEHVADSGGMPGHPMDWRGTMRLAAQWGYLALTASLISGAIWAQMAWGRYWSWDPKEVWTLTVWLIYTVCLHAYYRPGWRERRVAGLALLGFAAVLFTFLGIESLVRWTAVQSLHVF